MSEPASATPTPQEQDPIAAAAAAAPEAEESSTSPSEPIPSAPSTSTATTTTDAPAGPPPPPIKNLILDAAPLLTLTPLRGLASKYLIAPQVLAEIRDRRAREHFERLALLEGVEVEVRDIDPISLAKVTAFAKQTGDYAVLSHVDLCVLALTYAVEVEENGHWRVRDELGKPPAGRPPAPVATPAVAASATQPAALSASSAATPTTAPAASSDDAALPSLPPHAPPPAAESTSPKGEPPALPMHSTWGKRAPATAAVKQDEAEACSSNSTPASAIAAASHSTQEISARSSTPPPPSAPSSEAGPSTSRPSSPTPPIASSSAPAQTATFTSMPGYDEDPLSDDDEPEDDEDGAWVTPSNIHTHKARDLGLALPDDGNSGKTPVVVGESNRAKKKAAKQARPRAILKSACMTSDFAVQNVLIQMGLNLVGGEGRRIRSIRSWVLRCHACFKLCKDPTKKFCPSCGGPTLLRTSITTVSPSGAAGASSASAEPTTIVHLKKNFQYHNRGTQFSIPAPKMGSAKGQSSGGSGLVLREDQGEWQNAVRMEQGRQRKAERKLQKGVDDGRGAGTWRDADWMPEMYSAGMSGKGRSDTGGAFMPDIGHGRRNPNQVRRGKGKK